MADETKLSMEELQKQLDAVQAEQSEVKAQLGKFDESTALPQDGRTASEATADEIERAQVIRDPWAGKNALKILAHPPGKRLQWISPAYREKRGLRGWTAVRHDDAIGRELHKYINDPPSRMAGLTNIGEVVRRGDVVLAWIDEGIFNARIRKGQEKANRHMRDGAIHGDTEYGPYGRMTGKGLRDDKDSKYRRARPAPGFISPKRLDEYRARAVGTVEDPRIAVEGRRLFDDPSKEE